MKVRNYLKAIKKEHWYWVAGIAAGIAVISYGFGLNVVTVKQCKATVTSYVTAEFSETVVEMCTDSNGVMTTCLDTDYWSEPASRRFNALTIDGKVQSASFSGEGWFRHQALYPPMPARDRSMSLMPHFDNFREHTNEHFVIGTLDEKTKETDNVSKSISYNAKCMDSLGKHVFVKTWYGINYSVQL
jgi:hypothetical protein